MFSNNVPTLSDIAAVTGANDGFGGNNGWWIIILLLIFAGGWGNGGLFGNNGSATSSGITDGYILTSDFASLGRQMENGFDGIRQQGVQIGNGISSLAYDQLNQMNGINQNINSATNTITGAINGVNNGVTAQLTALGTQVASGFCENRYSLAEQTCQTRQAVSDAASAITLNQDANTRSILSAIQDMQTQALQDKIADLTAEKQSLQFAASQAAQNAYLINALSPNCNCCCSGV